MALKDCIRRLEKAGKPLTEKQHAALKEAKDAGLTDDQAVRKVVLMAHQKVVDITERARAEGATVEPFINPVTDVLTFQSKKLQKIADRKTEINAEVKTLADEFARRKVVQGWVGLTRLDPSGAPLSYINMDDDRQVLDAMVQMSFSIKKEKREKWGLKGDSANELFDSFRKMQAEMQQILEQITKLQQEKKDLDKTVTAVFSGVGEQTFDQAPITQLKVMHNIKAGGLIKADELGGLAVPSLAIMPKDQPFTGFGEISFIGRDDLADPQDLPIFDADGYTVRFPTPEYKPAPAKLRDPLISEIGAWEAMWGDLNAASYYVERHMRDHPNPQMVVWKMMDSDAVKAWYLTEVWGEDLTPKKKDVTPQIAWGWDDEVVEFFTDKENLRDWNRAWESPERQSLMKRAGEVAKRASVKRTMKARGITYEEAERRFAMGAMLTMYGSLTDSKFQQLVYDVQRKGTQELDSVSNREMLDARIKNNEMLAQMMGDKFGSEGSGDMHFKSWIEGKVGSSFGEPRLKLNGKWVEYNLENIVRKMKGKLRGTEAGFAELGTMDAGIMRALVAHRFKRLEEMRQRADTNISDPDAIIAAREEARNKMDAWSGQLAAFYIAENEHGYVDSYEAQDASRRAIVAWAGSTTDLATANDFEAALYREGFDDSMPDWLVDEGMIAAMDWLAVPVPYFEGKPQRAVSFDEFAGAVIPSDASPEVRAILQKHRIPFKEYPVSSPVQVAQQVLGGAPIDEVQARIDATNEFIEQLNNQGERTLFQSEIGFTSGLETAIKVMPREKGSPQEMLETLRKQPNVKQEEIDALGLEEWLEYQSILQAAEAGLTGEEYTGKTVITRSQLLKFIKDGGVRLEESFNAGEAPERGTYRPHISRASDAAYEELEDFQYDTPYDEFTTEIWDISNRDDPYSPTFRVWIDKDAGSVSVQENDTEEWLEVDQPRHADGSVLPGSRNDAYMYAAQRAIDQYVENQQKVPGSVSHVRWTNWTLPAPDRGPFNDRGPAINHREIRLHMPTVMLPQYTEENVELIDDGYKILHPQSPTSRQQEQNDLFWFFDVPDNVLQIPKSRYPTAEEAKAYILEEKQPGKDPMENFESHAFPEDNIIVWFRVNDRMGPKGEKIFFIEEVQSDLHQAGLTGGYRYKKSDLDRQQRKFEAIEIKAAKMLQELEQPFLGYWSAEEAFNEYMDWLESPPSSVFHNPFDVLSKKQRALLNEYVQVRRKTAKMEMGHDVGRTPNLPWKGDAWAELAMKRIIRMAVEQGYDQVLWTTGAQQVERYGIDTHFSEITWDPRSQELTTYDTDGDMVDNMYKTRDELVEMFGDERVLEMDRQIRDARERYEIIQVYPRSDEPVAKVAMQRNEMYIDDDDPFLDEYSKKWLANNRRAFLLLDENGEIVRQSGGAYQMWEYFDGAEEGRDDFAFGNELPSLVGVEVNDEESSGLNKRYNELMVNVTNRILKKLDKSVKVKRYGYQMEGDRPNHGVRVEREGGGNIAPGIVDPGAFYVEDYEDYDRSGNRVQISPRFDTYEEALEWSDNIGLGYGYTQHGFEITPDIQVNAMEGQTYFQNKNRGQITFDEENRAIIRMSQSKDMSTFLHESAHLYLELMADLIDVTEADPQLIDDYYKVLKFLGVNNRYEVKTEHHEKFARAFEAYMREGKSPTAELQTVFSAYSSWLRIVYDTIVKLLGPGEQLNDEIRGVFDRMVASERAIADSEDMLAYVQLYATAEEMGVSQEVFDVYKRDMQAEHDAEVDKLTRKALKSVAWAKQQWWKDERKKQAEIVRKEAEAMAVYRAMAMLQRGKNPDGSETTLQPIKLDKKDLIARYGSDFIKRLPGRGKYLMYSVKGGTDADVVANVYGFSDADELVKALIDAPKMEQWIKDEADRRMKELHPDPLNDPDIVEQAARQVHTTGRSKILAKELRALRKKMAEDKAIVKATKDEAKREDKQALQANKAQMPKRESMAQIKAAAALLIGKKRIRDIKPRSYMLAERKAGRLAFQAMERKDYAEAYKQKLAQIMNFEAYRAAEKAKAQSERDHKYLTGFNKPAKAARMGKAGYLERIQAVLEGIDLRKISMKRIDREKIENELMVAIDAGDIVTTPEIENLLRNPGGKNWKDMTFDEFAGIRDVVKQLEHQARNDLEIIINGEKVIIQEAVDEVANSIIENHDEHPRILTGQSGWESFKQSTRNAASHWLRSSSIARVLDKSGFGAVTKRVIAPIRQAMVEKLLPWQHKAAEDVADIYKKHYSNKELSQLGKKIPGSIMGQSWAKSDILALALHWGSEDGRAAILGGMLEDAKGNRFQAYSEHGIAEALSLMDDRDWAFVQDIWDYQESYWTQLAETEKRRRGIVPKKVESLPFTIRTVDGNEVSLRGGYHHLQYMAETGNLEEREQEFQNYYNRMQKGGYLSASTRAGATYNRTRDHNKVIKLTLNTIDQNLREILRDMALGDEVNLVNRVLNSREVKRAANNTNNMELLHELQLWLSDAAVGELPAQTEIEKLISWFRVGFTKSKLAFNVYVTLLQLTGAFQTMATIGTAQYMRGVGKFLTNPVGNYKMVMEQSKFMNARYGVMQAFDKDVADTKAFLQSYFGGVPTKFARSMDTVSHYYFWPIAKMQSLVDVTTWMAAHEQAMNNPEVNSREEAILYADSQVERAQTSGLFSDRSGIERGTLGTRTRQGQFVRLWTVLISYMLAKGNIAYEKGKITDFKDPRQAVGFAVDMVMLFAIEGMASAMLYGDWPDEEEDESLISWGAKATIESIASGIPMVREYSGAKYGSGTTPIGALTVDMWKTMEQLMQAEPDEAAVKATVKTMGTLFHLPSSQVNRAVEAMFKEDDADLHEWLMGVDDE